VAFHCRKYLCTGVLGVSLLAGCSKAPDEESDALGDVDPREFTVFSEVAFRELPDNAITSKFGPDGGEMSLGDMRLIVPEGAAQEEFDLSLIPAEYQPDDWSSRADRVRPVGQPFSLVARGAQAVLTDVEVKLHGVKLAEGEQLRLARLPSDDAMIAMSAGDGTLETGESAQQESRSTDSSTAAQSSSPTMVIDCDKDILKIALGDLDADWAKSTYQVVAIRNVPVHEVRLEPDAPVPEFCIYILDPPAHSLKRLEDRLVIAGIQVAAKSEELQLHALDAAGPKSITVQSFINVPSSDEHALPVGSRHIAISRNIHAYPPYSDPGFLERTLAEMYMRLVWNNVASRETLRLKKPDVNRWLIDGSVEWFVQQVYGDVPNYLRKQRLHSLDSLFSLRRQASTFIGDMEARHPGVLRDLMMWTQRAGMTRPKSEFIQYPRVLLSELLDRLLKIKWGDGLASAYADFAQHEMTYTGDPYYYPRDKPYSSLSMGNAQDFTSSSVVRKEISPLSGQQILFHSPVQRGNLSITVSEISSSDPLSSSALNFRVFGLENDGTLFEFQNAAAVPRSSPVENWLDVDIDDFGEGGRFVGVLLQIIYDDFRRYSTNSDRDSSSAQDFVATHDIGDLVVTVEAGFIDLKLPMSTLLPKLPGGDKHCVGNIPGRQCQATIQQAINLQAVEPGDSILVAPGRYNESVEVNKADLTIHGAAPGKVIVAANGNFAFDIQAPGTRITNFIIVREGRKFPANADWAINVGAAASSSYIANNIVIANPGTGIQVLGGKDHKIFGNWIAVSNNGIAVNAAPETQIKNNVITPLMVREHVRSWQIDPNGVIVPGTMPEIANLGIQILNSNHAEVAGNYVVPDLGEPAFAWHQAFHASGIDTLNLNGNHFITATSQPAITLRNIENLIAVDNRVVNEGGGGYDIGDIRTGTIANNKVDTGTTALKIANSRTVTMARNSLYGNTGAFQASNSQGIYSFNDYFDGWHRDRNAADSFNKRAVYLNNVVSATFEGMYAVGTTETVKLEGTNGITLNNADIVQLREDHDVYNPGVALYLKNAVKTNIVGGSIISKDGGVRISGNKSAGNKFKGINMADPDLDVGFYLESKADDISNILFYPGYVDFARATVPVEFKNTVIGLSISDALAAIDHLKMSYAEGPGFTFVTQFWLRPYTCDNTAGGVATPFFPFIWRGGILGSDRSFEMQFSQSAALSPLAPTPGYRMVMCLPFSSTGEWRPPNTAVGSRIGLGLQRVKRKH
jgi:nitrous oxidase accessory protein NosD